MENDHNSENLEFAENILDIMFISHKVGEHNCNINRGKEDVQHLFNFDHASPKFSPEHGPYLEIVSKNSNKPAIMHLNNSVAQGMLVENSKNMTDEEYYEAFISQKKVLVDTLIRKTYAKGYQTPSAVQEVAIPELIQRKDVLIQFKSGTGKTHAFLFGLLWGFDPKDDALQYVFITSSHEVAGQIYGQAKDLLPEATKIVLCIGQKKETSTSSSNGGFKMPISTSSLNSNRPKSLKEERSEVSQAQVIVCTMGKFYDFLCNKKWISNIKYLKAMCIDEFDNIVTSRSKSRNSAVMSTEEQMCAIIKEIPKTAQRAFFSATVSEQALQIAHSYFRPYSPSIGEPFIVLLDIEDYTLKGIRQYYVQVGSFVEKKDVLLDLLKQCRIESSIIFTNRIETANELQYLLEEQHVAIISAVFHGGLPAVTRQAILKDFIENKTRVLISTDLTARGLDVQSVNLVINYDMPEVLETYIHRVGRSGRYGRKGVAISFILVNREKNEMKKVDGINECSKLNKMESLPMDLGNLL